MHKNIPPGFPKNTIPVQRALCAIMLLTPEKLQETIALLYHASFVEHRDVVDKDTLFALLTRVQGEDGAKDIIAKVESYIQVKKPNTG